MSAVESAPSASAVPRPSGRGRLAALLPMVVSPLLAASMAAAAVWLMVGRHPPSTAAVAATSEAGPAGHEPAAAGAAAAASRGTALYLPLSPAFTVNLADADGGHFLQVEIEVMAREPAALDAVKANLPQIRNALLLLLGQLKAHDIVGREAKEALQKQVVEEIRRVLLAETGKPGVDAVYFTSFVVQ